MTTYVIGGSTVTEDTGNVVAQGNVNVNGGNTYQLNGTSIFATANTWTATQTFPGFVSNLSWSASSGQIINLSGVQVYEAGGSPTPYTVITFPTDIENSNNEMFSIVQQVNGGTTDALSFNASVANKGTVTILNLATMLNGSVLVGTLSSYKNTLDDGSGNMTLAGTIKTGGGGTAPTVVSVPASGTAYTPSTTVNTVLFVSGGTVTAIAVNGTSIGLTSGTFYMKANDTITFTYTVVPTVYQMNA